MDFFDLHCDTPYECFKTGDDFYENTLAVSGRQGKSFGRWRQTFAVWIKDDAAEPFELYKRLLYGFKAKLNGKPENLKPLFSVEGGAVLEEDYERLNILKNDGISFLTLTWNGENTLAGGCESPRGLTDLGKRAISEMNRLKIGCDLSHSNRKSFYSALSLADYPLATHSNCFAVCGNKRNLTDSQLKALADKGGVVGLCFYPRFLGDDVFEKIYRNIYHICDMGLERIIAVGSDFDGGVMDERLKKLSQIPDLYRYLQGRGLEKALLDKIFYENADNFVAKLNKKG